MEISLTLILRIIQTALLTGLLMFLLIRTNYIMKLEKIEPVNLSILRCLGKDKTTEVRDSYDAVYVEVLINLEQKLLKLRQPLSHNQKYIKVHIDDKSRMLHYLEKTIHSNKEDGLAILHYLAHIGIYTKIAIAILCIVVAGKCYGRYSNYAKESIDYALSIKEETEASIEDFYNGASDEVKVNYVLSTLSVAILMSDDCYSLEDSQMNIITNNYYNAVITGDDIKFDLPKSINPIRDTVLHWIQDYYVAMGDILHKAVVGTDSILADVEKFESSFRIKAYIVYTYVVLSNVVETLVIIFIAAKVIMYIIYISSVNKYRKSIGVVDGYSSHGNTVL